jgi:tRNA modification GTPase
MLGKFGDDAKDEVVLVVKQTDPVPWLELHCHGGVEVVRLFLESLEGRGVRVCSWQRLEQLTSGNPVQSLAAGSLAKAVTVRTASILLDQYHGAFEQSLQRIHAALDSNQLQEASRFLDELTRWIPVGRHLTMPWRVVVAGAPNVGKSSLVNALAGYQRSIVAATPGTTRDLVTTLLAVDGWPIELTDTAGLRDGAGTLEGQGMDRARMAVADTDCCLWVMDASSPPIWPEVASERVRVIANKIDLPAAWDIQQADRAVSALTGTGISELLQSLAHWLVPETPPAGAAVPFLPHLCERVEQARQHLAQERVQEARQALQFSWDAAEL